MSARHHRDVIACTLITLGSVIWLGGIFMSWFAFQPKLLLWSAPVTAFVGAWTAAMVLDDLEVNEAAISGGLAVALGLGLRQLDTRAAPELWMLGPFAIGVAFASLAAWLAGKVKRPRTGWRTLAAGLLTWGTSIAALVIVAAIAPGSDWRIAATLVAMVASGGVAYVLVPGIDGVHIVGGNTLLVAAGWAGLVVHLGIASAIGGALIGAVLGVVLGAICALLGFWGKPRHPEIDSVDLSLAKAQVVEKKQI